MRFRNLIKHLNPFHKKSVSIPSLYAAMVRSGGCSLTDWNLEKYGTEGYKKNVVAYVAIRDISRSGARIPWVIQRGEKDTISEHPLLDLFNKPNPLQGGSTFRQECLSQYMIYGNNYFLSIGPNQQDAFPQELWPLRPDRMEPKVGKDGIPYAYHYNPDTGQGTTYLVDKGRSPVFHWKTYNPTSMNIGMPPLEAGAMSVDRHNDSMKWNLKLLQNGCRPDGFLVVQPTDARPTGTLTEPEYERAQKQLINEYSGPDNVGKPKLLEGGLDWKQQSFSPKDMDWLEGTSMTARDIANILGYPPCLLGMKDSQTYNNQKEARLSLYEDTVIPLCQDYLDNLNRWLSPLLEPGIRIILNLDEVEILQTKKYQEWERIDNAVGLTVNEKRSLRGYEPVEGGDVVLIPSTMVPLINSLESEDYGNAPTNQ